MNKQTLIKRLALKHDRSVMEIKRIIDDFLEDIMVNVAEKKEEVQLVGFGKFSTIIRKSRKGRNPQTGETIQLPTSTRINFLPGSLFKRRLR